MKELKFRYSTGEYGFLSNFSNHPVIIDGKTYPTTEHYYQSQKFEGCPYWQNHIRGAKTPKEAALRGRNRRFPIRTDWETYKIYVMTMAIREKIKQHKYIQEKIVSLRDVRIIEDAYWDSFWGIGPYGKGSNMLGVIWNKEIKIFLDRLDQNN